MTYSIVLTYYSNIVEEAKEKKWEKEKQNIEEKYGKRKKIKVSPPKVMQA